MVVQLDLVKERRMGTKWVVRKAILLAEKMETAWVVKKAVNLVLTLETHLAIWKGAMKETKTVARLADERVYSLGHYWDYWKADLRVDMMVDSMVINLA